uniref:Uncharacterized protein n=1 Tax=Candidatus Kentrum sp. UNK TaxID=2126344 RepID=A0A451AXA0_9GAMM|nr:MAG: hypothetical protein BECKUNK1418G_GA0071005_102727 [Candidatus Kentron sp. UNK]VFK70622.1 MAG: hypothetical protein BECKUNK1418H_GA0071006_10349 [Candidatus Kentron sp. UNK]
MSVHIQPLAQISNRAKSVLIQELGVVDTMRFLNQFRAGSGDYTAEREQLFKSESVRSLVTKIKAQSAQQAPGADAR